MSVSDPFTPYSSSCSNLVGRLVMWSAGYSSRRRSVICVEETKGSTKVKSTDVFWKSLDNLFRWGRTSPSMARVQTKEGLLTKVARPAAVASWRSDASRSRLAISEGRHWLTARTAVSCDNQRVSPTSFSLMAGSPRMCCKKEIYIRFQFSNKVNIHIQNIILVFYNYDSFLIGNYITFSYSWYFH